MAFDPVGDLALMFGDFGVAVTIGTVDTVGLWDQSFEAVQPGEGIVEGTTSVLLVRTSEIPDAGHGEVVTVAGVDYSLTNIEPDGDGLTRLQVSRYAHG